MSDRDAQIRSELYTTYNELLAHYQQVANQMQAGQVDPTQGQQALAYYADQINQLHIANPETGVLWRIDPQSGAYQFCVGPGRPWEQFVEPSHTDSYWGHDSVVEANTQALVESARSTKKSEAVAGLKGLLGKGWAWFGGLSRLKKALVVLTVLVGVMAVVNSFGGRTARACPELAQTQIVDVTNTDLLPTINCMVALQLMPSDTVGDVGVRFRPEIPVDFATLAVASGNTLAVLEGRTPGDPVEEGVRAYEMGLVPSPDVENPAIPILRSHAYVALAGVVAHLDDAPAPVGAPAAAELLRRYGILTEDTSTQMSASMTRYELAVLLRNVYESGLGFTVDDGEPRPVGSTVPQDVPASSTTLPFIIEQ